MIPTERPLTVIIGAGFAGLSAARALAYANTDVVLIDRSNHHVFLPLLYQVATAALSPAQIAQPIRTILKEQKNCTVALGEVTDIDTASKIVRMGDVELPYDFLIVATGATHAYFNHPEWAEFAPGLRTITDALHIRGHIISAFEKAELSFDPQEQESLLTFVLIGAGPTGAEMAGAIAELARHTLKGEFRRINPADAHVILVEAAPRILTAFPPSLSEEAKKDLEQIGVRVITGQPVVECGKDGVKVGETFIPCKTVLWTAGVKASPAAEWLKAPADRAGRVIVSNCLHLPDDEDIFVIGDTAQVVDRNGRMIPGLAPAAMQQGRYVAETIRRKIRGLAPQKPFAYRDWGIMATLGRGAAIARVGGMNLSGFMAWALWGLIHLMPLVGFRNRMVVAVDWMWTYFSGTRGVRLMTAIKPINQSTNPTEKAGSTPNEHTEKSNSKKAA